MRAMAHKKVADGCESIEKEMEGDSCGGMLLFGAANFWQGVRW